MQRKTRRSFHWFSACLVLVAVVSCSSNGPTGPSDTDFALACQATVDAMSALHSAIDSRNFPQLDQGPDVAKERGWFDVSSYFSVLSHLSMKDGYVLDYVYYYDWMGGLPVLYTREDTAEAYTYFRDYIEAIGDVDPTTLYYGYLNEVHADSTGQGFFEWVVLRIMGDQFYLYWHAAYHDERIICAKSGLEAVIEKLPPEDQRRARGLDVAPRISLADDTAKVSIVIFTNWGGFYRWTYTIGRQYPHEIFSVDEEQLMAYDCGYVY